MREVKNPVERKTEIIAAAEKLFLSKGYHTTTIIDILNEVGIAKGTFYYYFKSKEEVMDKIIERVVREDVIDAKTIAKDPSLSVQDKLFKVFVGQKAKCGSKKADLLEEIHRPNNVEMHQKSLVTSIIGLSPVLKEIIDEGIAEGIFTTEYPQETMELLIVSGQTLFDKAWFSWSEEEFLVRAKALISMMESSLGAKKGSFEYMLEVLP